ncbi:MAG: TonB-dependent receptor domain-containing protein, partial [Gammaproteobacteria bacterium]
MPPRSRQPGGGPREPGRLLQRRYRALAGIYAHLNDDARWTARMKNLNLVMNYRFDNGYTLTSQTGHIDAGNSRVFNYSGTPINSIILTTRYAPVSMTSTELRLTSPEEDAFSWMAGLYYDELETEQTPKSKNAGAYIFFYNQFSAANAPAAYLSALNGDTEETESYSAFGEGTYRFNDQLKMSVGLRYGKEKKDAVDLVGLRVDLPPGGTGLPLAFIDPGLGAAFPNGALYTTSYTDFSQVPAPCFAVGGGAFVSPNGAQCSDEISLEDKFLTWSTKLQYDLTDEINLYATIGTGYKGGGVDNGGNTFVREEKIVENEDSIAYELGSKMRLLDGRMTLNLALFLNQFDDLQVGAQSPDTGVIVVRNAAEAETKGIEADLVFAIDDSWTVGGSIALLEAE